VRLAEACPNLRAVSLEGVSNLGDAPLLAFLEKCPNLRSLDITPASKHSSDVSKSALQALKTHTEWAPQLEELAIQDSRRTKGWEKALKAASRARPELEITVVSVSEKKIWGDWELEVDQTTYRDGRECEPDSDELREMMDAMDSEDEWDSYRMTGDISESYLQRQGYF
jgi:hypothetical protein